MLLKNFLALTPKERSILSKINLSNNNFCIMDHLAFIGFYDALLDCQNLEELFLDHNFLGDLPSYFFDLLAEILAILPLKILSICNNNLNFATTMPLIAGCCNLHTIQVKNNYYTNTDHQFLQIIMDARKNKQLKITSFLMLLEDELQQLKSIDLSGENLFEIKNKEELTIIKDTFKYCTNLEEINLSYNILSMATEYCLEILRDALAYCPIKKIFLTGNRLTVEKILLIINKCPQLNNIEVKIEEGDHFYLNNRTEHEKLQELIQRITRNNSVTPKSRQQLELYRPPSLRKLSASGSSIDIAQSPSLVRLSESSSSVAINSSPYLKRLSASSNSIDLALSPSLRRLPNLSSSVAINSPPFLRKLPTSSNFVDMERSSSLRSSSESSIVTAVDLQLPTRSSSSEFIPLQNIPNLLARKSYRPDLHRVTTTKTKKYTPKPY